MAGLYIDTHHSQDHDSHDRSDAPASGLALSTARAIVVRSAPGPAGLRGIDVISGHLRARHGHSGRIGRCWGRRGPPRHHRRPVLGRVHTGPANAGRLRLRRHRPGIHGPYESPPTACVWPWTTAPTISSCALPWRARLHHPHRPRRTHRQPPHARHPDLVEITYLHCRRYRRRGVRQGEAHGRAACGVEDAESAVV